MENKTYNGKGIHEFTAHGREKIKLRTFEEYTVQVKLKGEEEYIIVAPKESTSRFEKIVVNDGDFVRIYTGGEWTVSRDTLPDIKEEGGGESMVEIIPEHEMNMYDRLRAEMMGVISRYAEAKELDSWEDDNDFELEDEDEPLIDTPYEYKAVIEETPIESVNKERPYQVEDEKENPQPLPEGNEYHEKSSQAEEKPSEA